jgi:formylglycine-generating enzyme required for sulfatase activity
MADESPLAPTRVTNAPLAVIAQPPASDKLGYYLLCEILGQGGMGRVFRAFDEKLQREVALKVMLPHVAADEALRRRFLREARAMAALDHSNVVPVHHVDETGPVPFFVMPLLKGETLQALLRRERMLPVADALRIGRQTAQGLAHAHERRLIHRDVKPGNLWLEERTGNVKILDFGLVRLDPESIALTQTGMAVGTVGFMAPEQEAGGEVDHRSDQYSLGCVLYLLCTGRTVAMTRFRDPHAVNASVSQCLSEAIMRLLSLEPNERFLNMGEVAHELVRIESLHVDHPPPRPQLPSPVALPIQESPVLDEREIVRPLSPLARSAPLPESFTNSIGMKFVLVKPGRFLMGSPPSEAERGSNEHQHEVTITKPFYLGVHPVTQGQWKKVMGRNPSHFCATGSGKDRVEGLDTDDFPVEQVSWQDVQNYLKKLTTLNEEKTNRRTYRLPTEAEWEYACRGGHWIKDIQDRHIAPFHFEQPTSSLNSAQANFDGKFPYGDGKFPFGGADPEPYLQRTCQVGSYKPNCLGVFDMHGNVWEWCADWYGDYEVAPTTDPTGPPQGSVRVIRGGSWLNTAGICRSARRWFTPGVRYNYLGFRVALVPAQ